MLAGCYSTFFQLLVFLAEALLALNFLNPLFIQSLRVTRISSLTANEKTRSIFFKTLVEIFNSFLIALNGFLFKKKTN